MGSKTVVYRVMDLCQNIKQSCQSCVFFDDDPASIEKQLPGITVLGSAYGSVRGNAGICRKLNLFMDPILASGCKHYMNKSSQTPSINGPKNATDKK